MDVTSSERAVAESCAGEKPWEEPAILMERSLVAKAQEAGQPTDDPFLGPLNLSNP